jgi:hypothetical protein
MLKAEGIINDVVIKEIMNWHHSDVNLYFGKTIRPHNKKRPGKPGAL